MVRIRYQTQALNSIALIFCRKNYKKLSIVANISKTFLQLLFHKRGSKKNIIFWQFFDSTPLYYCKKKLSFWSKMVKKIWVFSDKDFLDWPLLTPGTRVHDKSIHLRRTDLVGGRLYWTEVPQKGTETLKNPFWAGLLSRVLSWNLFEGSRSNTTFMQICAHTFC